MRKNFLQSRVPWLLPSPKLDVSLCCFRCILQRIPRNRYQISSHILPPTSLFKLSSKFKMASVAQTKPFMGASLQVKSTR